MDNMENEEIEFETYNDEEEQSISVSGGMEYTPLKVEDLPRSEKEDKVIQKKIYSGEDFYEEKEHLRIVINCINKKIKSIESKSSYTGKYAVCRGGDDGTMQLQLRSNKESSEHDRLIVNELKDRQATPYRYRVDIEENGKVVVYYFGIEEYEAGENHIYSVHSDFGNSLVNYDPTNKDVNSRLYLRREFDIQNKKLISYVNLSARNTGYGDLFKENITDPFLIKVLKSKRQEHKSTDIFVTIQKEQNNIVKSHWRNNIIVQGCAGSGKTMVLLHRLSRIHNFEKAFTAGEVLLLTPSEQYSVFMKAVTEGLSIQRIHQITLENYYQELLGDYGKEFVVKSKITSDFKVKEGIVKYIYSEDFIIDFKLNIEDTLKKRRELIDEVAELCNDMGIVLNIVLPDKEIDVYSYLVNVMDMINNKCDILENDITEIADKVEALKERKEAIMNKVIPELVNRYNTKLLEVYNSIKEMIKGTEYEELLGELNDDAVIEKMTETLSVAKAVIKESIPGCDELDNVNKELLLVADEYNKKDEIIEKAEKELHEAINRQLSDSKKETILAINEKIKKSSNIGVFRAAYQKTLEPYLQLYGLKRITGTHRFDLYARLLFCIDYFGEVTGRHKLICVDEGQDIAAVEYAMIKKMNSEMEPVFNIFGDVKQCINLERGISDWEQIAPIIIGCKKYILRQNYRNTEQITRYCNANFEVDMMKIGISGKKVSYINLKMACDIINQSRDIGNERWAFLIPHNIKKKKMYEMLDNPLISDNVIGNGIISIMYVDEVKGFEFDRILYMEDGMTENEQYIAATRAMDNLYVICNDIHEKKKGKRKGKNKKKSSKQNQQNNRRRITIDDLRGFEIKSYVYNRIDYKSLPTISVEIKYGRTTKSIIISYDMEKKLILVPEGIFRMYEKEIRKIFKIK